jgi:heme-degrading monooxygenase HmoA
VITEHALLEVRAGQAEDFEAAFAEAKSIIAAAAGFISLELQRCIERPGRYILLVRWASLEDHTEGFRGSPGYQEWKELLHHFYDPLPTVEHFRLVAES